MPKILLVTVGSRGDVQPYVALGHSLQAAGHDVTVATCERFQSFVTGHGLAFGSLSDGFMELIDSQEGRTAMDDASGVLGLVRMNIQLARKAGLINRELMSDVWRVARSVEPDIVVYHPKALAGPHVAEALGVPAVLAVPVPVAVPTGAFPVVGMPNLPLGAWYNRLTYRLVAAGYKGYNKMVNTFRRDALGLGVVKGAAMATHRPGGQPTPVLHGISRHVVPRPADWPEHADLTGYWFLDGTDDWTPPTDLVDFLAAGEPPVYVGFGSMAGRDPKRVTGSVVGALRLAGVRGIIATGWGGLEPVDLPDTVLRITEVPHDWLLPRVSAVVHHGGAGTTAAALRAGKPAVICPFIVDQFFWGRQVAALGAGSTPIPQAKLTAQRLADALREVTTSTRVQHTAAEIGRRIAAENGAADAVARIEAIMSRTS
ncbi:glycosyltransferase [Nocardiopsis sp. YSL2]|uniref:glycosyltransferase n=1 Tax=Nocardiopsis sp. YSL2 TaxID=2939492 RepID=UPI0026F41664|nr:glycosyltransferase [Nocardiopsis sp. YSL2]